MVYSMSISQTKGKIMATQITLTDNQVRALFKWCYIGSESEAAIESPMEKHLDQIVAKLEKAGWE